MILHKSTLRRAGLDLSGVCTLQMALLSFNFRRVGGCNGSLAPPSYRMGLAAVTVIVLLRPI